MANLKNLLVTGTGRFTDKVYASEFVGTATQEDLKASTADWNQNDPNANNYVKNRTHWTEDVVENTIVDNLSITLTGSSGYYYSQDDIECSATFNTGDIWIVTWDNITYTLTVTVDNHPYDGALYAVVSNDILAIECVHGQIYLSCVAMPTTPSLTLIARTAIVHKIDSKYLELPDFPQNIVDGSSIGSVRTIGSAEEVIGTYMLGNHSFAEGSGTKAGNSYGGILGAHAEGINTTASQNGAHAEGYGTTASNYYAHAEGRETTASGEYSHAEGYGTKATVSGAHAEGINTQANAYNGSHAEGFQTKASAAGGHAEGHSTEAFYYAHAEGISTKASGNYSHAEGEETKASSQADHSEGKGTEAKGSYSHAEGLYTIASSSCQHTQGRYNIADTSYAHIVGNGNSDTSRSNAHTLDWYGNAWFAGTVEGTAIILKSSTSGSTKRFLITVNDSGTLSTTEIT